jgi:hypothetical protein
MNQTEEIFVNTFIQKNRRDRALYELTTESKRWKFCDRLCHDYLGMFESKYLQPISDLGFDPVGLLKRLTKLGAKETCHVISSYDDVDGKQLPLEEAIQATLGRGFPSVLICVADSLAYFEAEQVKGPPPRYLLINRKQHYVA